MNDVNVYYCWACDAHRRVESEANGKIHCPACERELPPDARLPLRILHAGAESARKAAWPAPIRPRLAASA